MPPELTQDYIARRLRESYEFGVTASTDGYAELYESVIFKCAAVLVPLVWKEDEWHLLFTRRTDTVEHHKGQVSFPGGACDGDESTPEQTALREAEEEIGIKPGYVRLLGRLNEVITITHFRVTPVVGTIPFPYEFRLEVAEVSLAFTIPLLWLARRENWDEQLFKSDGIVRHFPVITYHSYDGEILWGASARIAQNFLAVMGLLEE